MSTRSTGTALIRVRVFKRTRECEGVRLVYYLCSCDIQPALIAGTIIAVMRLASTGWSQRSETRAFVPNIKTARSRKTFPMAERERNVDFCVITRLRHQHGDQVQVEV